MVLYSNDQIYLIEKEIEKICNIYLFCQEYIYVFKQVRYASDVALR